MQHPSSKKRVCPLAIVRRTLASAAIGLLFVQAAVAQAWTERPYNPAPGSRWLIVSEADSEDLREAVHHTRHISSRAELTIEDKLPDGFRVSYVMRDVTVTGTAPMTEIMNASLGTMKDITIRGRTDASGTPAAIDHLDEVKASMRAVIARIVEPFRSKPKLAAVIEQLMNGLLIVDGAAAARAYMGELSALAAAQNTGLKPGEVKRRDETVRSPLGGAMVKSVLSTRLASWDNAAGTARIVSRRELDPDSIKAMTMAIAGKFAAAAGGPASSQLLDIVKRISFAMDSETTIDVRDGMARSLQTHTTMTATMMGHTFRKVETKTVTVTELH